MSNLHELISEHRKIVKKADILKRLVTDYLLEKELAKLAILEIDIKDLMFENLKMDDREIFERVYRTAYTDTPNHDFEEIFVRLKEYDELVQDVLEIYKGKHPYYPPMA